MKGLLPYYWLVTAAFLFAGSADAQHVHLQYNKNRIFIGEQIIVKISAEEVPMGTPWVYLPDTVNHLEIVEKSKIDTIVKGNVVNFYQTIAVTSFDSGTWKFPSLVFPGLNQTTIPFSVEVMPVDVSHLKDYNDIKDIIEYQKEINWWLVLLAVVLLSLMLALVWWYFKRRKTKGSSLPVTHESPLKWAMQELEKISEQQYKSADAVQFFYRLTLVSRTFFHRQFQHKSLYQTSDEWMVALQNLPLDTELRTYFCQMLRLADVVKFARYLPADADMQSALQNTRQIIEHAAYLPPFTTNSTPS